MRFMEHAVHENIMRQTRTSSKKHPPGHWSENNNVLGVDKYDSMPMMATEPICELSDSYDSELHQPSFSDISSFFEESPESKRVKLEPSQSEDQEDEEDDDDFDEDAASENMEEERGKRSEPVKPPNAGVFTIEVLDDDEEMEQSTAKGKNSSRDSSNTSGQSHSNSQKSEPDSKPASISHSQSQSRSPSSELPFKYISIDATTNTEPTGGDLQDEADRMFLLSLMPFLQRLDERRRLRVRQKLQNVLIEELEFG